MSQEANTRKRFAWHNGNRGRVAKMPMNFKVTFANGTSMKLMGLPDDITLDGLRAQLFEKTSIPPQDQHGKDTNTPSVSFLHRRYH